MKRKRTIRRMPPQTRKVAYAINEAQTALRRLESMLPAIQTVEMESIALHRAAEAWRSGENVAKLVPDDQLDLFDEEGGENERSEASPGESLGAE